MKDLTGREKGATKQQKSGKSTEWEAPLVLGLGIDWRHQRDLCATYSEWMKKCEQPIQDTLAKWKLAKKPEEDRPNLKRKWTPPADKEPEAVITLLPKDWEWDNKGFRLVVDCQPLAMVLNGETPWSNDWRLSEIHYTCNTLRQWVVRRGLPDLLAKPVSGEEESLIKWLILLLKSPWIPSPVGPC